MQTAKLFVSGQGQAVRLPKECRFEGTEINIQRQGKKVVLFQKEDKESLFYASLGRFSDDVFTSIEEARAEQTPNAPRETL